MADTPIKVPFLQPGLSYTVAVLDPLAGDTDPPLETVALTTSPGANGSVVGSGVVSTAIAGTMLFDVLHAGNRVESVPRVQSIADDENTYTILTGLPSTAPVVGAIDLDALCSDIWGIVLDENCEGEDDVLITARMTKEPDKPGFVWDKKEKEATSATQPVGESAPIAGAFLMRGVARGGTYEFVRGPNGFGTQFVAATPLTFGSPDREGLSTTTLNTPISVIIPDDGRTLIQIDPFSGVDE